MHEGAVAREGAVLGLGPSGFHRMVYSDWPGPVAAAVPPAVCVHGLTLNGRSFDRLAPVLAERRRVVCPDIVGRGRSDRLPDPAGYAIPQYAGDMAALLSRLGVPDTVPQVDWIGTSMGGLMGLVLAAQPQSPIRRLVLNDIGPFVPASALAGIAAYVGAPQRFADLDAAASALARQYPGFGPLAATDWYFLAERLTEECPADSEPAGRRPAYDPAIAIPFREAAGADLDLWPLWDRIACPVLVLRGAASDVLPAGVAAGMAGRGPGAKVVELPGVGHAPALLDPMQIACIRDWLDA